MKKLKRISNLLSRLTIQNGIGKECQLLLRIPSWRENFERPIFEPVQILRSHYTRYSKDGSALHGLPHINFLMDLSTAALQSALGILFFIYSGILKSTRPNYKSKTHIGITLHITHGITVLE